jgi:type IV pilus assembly protein PilN
MIRINLLPREDKAQRSKGVSFNFDAGDLVIPVGVLAAVGLVIAGTAFSQRSRAAALEKSIAEVEQQSRELAPQIERVNQLVRERAELDLRLGIINRLEKGRSASVRLMDELARSIPDHLWLSTANQESATQLSIEGATFSNLVVSDFMSRLEQSAMFAGVELEVAERAVVQESEVVRFRITCQVTPDEPAN